ncbi:MAG: BatA domain-containing protein [Flavobacteriales bacterium]|nr:BatA domain-containing protein [Flavobacteriales bacterium]
MKFIHPEILWALGALAIPVIVHLFNFRRFKKVLFPNVAFLKEIKQETQSRNKLKHLLILAARLLAVAAIVLAFAQPFIPASKQEKIGANRVAGVYIDNSFSMEAEEGGVRLLDLAKNKAIEIVSAYAPADRFALVTNDFEGKHQRLVSQEEMIEWIQEVEVSPAVRTVSDVYSRLREPLSRQETPNRSIFLLSDFQKSTSDIANIEADTTISLRLVPNAYTAPANLFVDSLWFDSPVRTVNVPEVLHVRVKNISEEAATGVPVELSVNGQQKAVGSVDIPAASEAEVELSYANTTTGAHHCEVRIDDSPVVFDDVFYFSYDVAEQVFVTEIFGVANQPGTVPLVFADNMPFAFQRMPHNSVDFGVLGKQNLVIVNQVSDIATGMQSELTKLVEEGASLFISPAADANVAAYNALLAALQAPQLSDPVESPNKVSTVNFQHPVYRSVTEPGNERLQLPSAGFYFPVDVRSAPGADVLAGWQNGSSFLCTGNFGKGRWYLLSVPLSEEASDFDHNWLFPVTMLNVANYSRAGAPLYYTIGADEVINLRNVAGVEESAFRVKSVTDSTEFIPGHRLMGPSMEFSMQGAIERAGNYRLTQTERVLAPLAFNYDRDESATYTYSNDELNSILTASALSDAAVLTSDAASIRKGALELNEGKKLWWTCVVWALIFLAIEVLLIKFWR